MEEKTCDKRCDNCKKSQKGLFFTQRLYCGEERTGQMYEVSPSDKCESWEAKEIKEVNP